MLWKQIGAFIFSEQTEHKVHLLLLKTFHFSIR